MSAERELQLGFCNVMCSVKNNLRQQTITGNHRFSNQHMCIKLHVQ